MTKNEQTPIILNGKVLADLIEKDLKLRVENIRNTSNVIPVLAAIMAGDDPSSTMHLKMKENACNRIGMGFCKIQLPQEVNTEEIISRINLLNMDENVHGIFLQYPVPVHIDLLECFDIIDVSKDVDGVNSASLGRMSMNLESFKCATPLGIVKLLKFYNIQIEGKEVVVAGRSPVLGKPVAMMMLNENATVTICHSNTHDLPNVLGKADILISALGKPKSIKATWLKEGVVVVDAGYYNQSNVGDVDFDNSVKKCYAYSPVPGGVGPMTISCLLTQTIEAAEKKVFI